jgi:hypothetical protein
MHWLQGALILSVGESLTSAVIFVKTDWVEEYWMLCLHSEYVKQSPH